MVGATGALFGDAHVAQRFASFTDMFIPMSMSICTQIQRHAPSATHILDLAAGPGEPSCYLSRQLPGASIICTDVAQNMIDAAKIRIQSNGMSDNVEFKVLNMEDMTSIPSASQDVVTVQLGLMFPDLKKALSEIMRVLTPGGLLVGTVWKANGHLHLSEHVITKLTGNKFTMFAADKGPEALKDAPALDARLQEAGFVLLDGHNAEQGLSFSFGKIGVFDTFDLCFFPFYPTLEQLETEVPGAKEKAKHIFESTVQDMASKSGGQVQLPNSDNEPFGSAFRLVVARRPSTDVKCCLLS